MNNFDFKNITENLIETFNFAGKESIRLFNEGLKIEIKNDKSPVSNGAVSYTHLTLPTT